MEAPPFPTTIGTRKLKIYTVISITTVLLAVVEGGQHMGLYGFVAIFICQPWLIVGWLLEANGVVCILGGGTFRPKHLVVGGSTYPEA
jgi:hypothetical protein